jgi:L-iditol 2-dehydrogenase
VLGAGPIGLVVLMCAQAFGADQVVITDIRQSNLDFAQQHYQPVKTLCTKPLDSPASVAQALQEAFADALNPSTPATAAAAAAVSRVEPATANKPQGTSTGSVSDSTAAACDHAAASRLCSPDIVIDCVGMQQTLEAAIKAVKPGGRIVLVGMGAEDIRVPAITITCKEIDLLGSFRYANTYPLCLSLIGSKRVDVKPLITHRFRFTESDVAEGFDTAARADRTGAIKVMFNLG